MSTATITWTPPAGIISQQLYYGKMSVVTGTPLAGTGWIAFGGNPLNPLTDTAVINGLVDFFKYRFVIISTMPGGGTCSAEVESISYSCATLDFTITDGVLEYELTLPSGINPSDIVAAKVELTGNGPTVIRYDDEFLQPLVGPYTGQFIVPGGYNWTIMAALVGAEGSAIGIKCSVQSFTTPPEAIILLRNGLVTLDTLITACFIEDTDPPSVQKLTASIGAGDSSPIDMTGELLADRYVGITIPGIFVFPTVLKYRISRANATVYQGTFNYTGANSVLSATPFQFQANDIIDVSDVDFFLENQVLAKYDNEVYDGYQLQVRMSTPPASDKNFDITMIAFDRYGNYETFTRQVTVPSGSTYSNVYYQPSGLPGWPNAFIESACVLPEDNSIIIAPNLECPLPA